MQTQWEQYDRSKHVALTEGTSALMSSSDKFDVAAFVRILIRVAIRFEAHLCAMEDNGGGIDTTKSPRAEKKSHYTTNHRFRKCWSHDG